jgi:hypothetical protein
MPSNNQFRGLTGLLERSYKPKRHFDFAVENLEARILLSAQWYSVYSSFDDIFGVIPLFGPLDGAYAENSINLSTTDRGAVDNIAVSFNGSTATAVQTNTNEAVFGGSWTLYLTSGPPVSAADYPSGTWTGTFDGNPATMTVTPIPPPELSGLFSNMIPSAAEPGDTISTNLVITSTADSTDIVNGNETTNYYLSTTPNLDGALTPVLAANSYLLNLNAGGSYTEIENVIIPQNITLGTYYLVAQLDATGAIVSDDATTPNIVVDGPIDIQNDTYTLSVPAVYQNASNSPWLLDPLAGTEATVGNSGCALTDLVMALNYAGFSTDPGSLNAALTATPGFTGGDILNWGPATSLADPSLTWVSLLPGSTYEQLGAELELAQAPIIVQVYNPTTQNQHFVLVTGFSGDTFYINDPGYPSGNRSTLNWYTNQGSSFQIRGYVRDPQTDLSRLYVAVTSSNPNLTAELIDSDGNVTGVSAPNAPVQNEIPNSDYFAQGPLEDLSGQNPGTTTTEFIYLTTPLNGNYNLELQGTGTYQVEICGVTPGGNLDQPLDFSGTMPASGAFWGSFAYSAGAVPTSITVVPDGWVDAADWGQISGWAFDPSTPLGVINVEVQIAGGPAEPQVISADQTREDLESVLGSTDHGFDYSPPFLSVGSHAFSVWAIEDNGEGVLIGTGTIVSQNSMFDEGYYLREYPNVAAAVNNGEFATGYEHFLQYGQYEGYIPSPYWDYWANQWYEEENPDVAAWAAENHLTSAFMQYYNYGQYENRGGLLYFNASYYLSNYPWVATAVQNGSVTSAFEHYLLYGQYAGYSPMLYFSPAVCDADNAYIAPYVTGEPFTSDFEWFIEYGQYEGAVVSNYYNEQIYLADNPDVAAAVEAGLFPDGFQHWLEYGQYEGRRAV